MVAKKVILLWGIPASGKTTYANSLIKQASIHSYTLRKQIQIVDIDQLMHKCQGDKLIQVASQQTLGLFGYNIETAVLDGLITTNEVARKLMLEMKTSPLLKDELSFEIVFWERDVEACKHNDRGRRNKNSKVTIENIPFEEPSQDLIREFNIKVTRKLVAHKPNWMVWAQENGVYFDDKGRMKGSSWSLGGTWANCWGDNGTVSADPPPASFAEFDELLEKVCPNIGFLTYKIIYGNVVTTETSGEGDYYGGHTKSACYVCNVEELYALLLEKGLIQPISS